MVFIDNLKEMLGSDLRVWFKKKKLVYVQEVVNLRDYLFH